ncbi:nuclear transport factor 2 family protein [Bradyrhizobium sp. WSM 1704]|uniref:YybH family protein n=1 Tax=Bradyrhizobium semiaridum TaxID=2821404 RepID=UPI001CE31FA1|nr:nuclear transport factor 2 family protein [Bradyrhizobium semiaridum]MCA6124779.1 nuclear transport factor 2 family protein [Bradyrhizobium semiaridum]
MRIIALALLLMTSAAVVHAEDDEHAILSANEAFEKAWSARDITAIEKLWAHEPYVFVVHPSSKEPEIGWENVRSSFGTQASRYTEFVISMTETKVHVNGDTAFVVGLEAFRGKRLNGDTVEGKAIGTRGFERKSGQWLVVFHQATPVR